jgi:branched-chain amino acid transport system permease protein
LMLNLRIASYGLLRKLSTAYLALAGTALAIVVGASVMVEMVYHIKLNEALGPTMGYAGATLNTRGMDAWVGAGLLLVTGIGLFEVARREFMRQWGHIQEAIETENLRRQAL